jgi:hypothetical protein
MNTTTFEKAKVGDKVWDYRYGYGIVESVESQHFGSITYIFEQGPYKGCSNVLDLAGKDDEGVRYLFWDEIKFEVPVQPPRMKLIHGVEVPDISFKPSYGECYVFPDVCATCPIGVNTYENYVVDRTRSNRGLCYPDTEEGKQAAILHAKAMLGIG